MDAHFTPDLTQNHYLTRQTHTNISMLIQYHYDAAGVTRALNFFKEDIMYQTDKKRRSAYNLSDISTCNQY